MMTPEKVREQALYLVGTIPGHVLHQKMTAEEIAQMVNDAIDEDRQQRAEQIEQLQRAVIALLDILRRWEPDWSNGEDRHQIVQAMYLVGILHDPAKAVEAMKVGAGETAEVRP
jgi:hypothetical protein